MSQAQWNGNGRWLKLSLLVVVVLNLLLMASIWLPQLKRSPARERGIGGREHDLALQFLEETLKLTPEQRQNAARLRAEHFAKTDALRRQINALRRQIMDEVLAASPDREKVARLAAELGEKQGKVETLTFAHFLSLFNLCQPGQKEKFRSLINELLERPKPPRPDSGSRPGERKRRGPLPANPRPSAAEDGRGEAVPAATGGEAEKTERRQPPQPGESRDEVSRIPNQVERLRVRLGLSDEQAKKLGPLIEPFARRIDEIRSRAGADPRAGGGAEKSVKDERDEMIASILTPEQKVLFEEMKRERREQSNPPPRRRDD